MKNTFLKLSAFLLVVLLGYSAMFAAPKITPGKAYKITKVGKMEANKLADFTFIDDNNKECSFLDIAKNKIAFLNFWATWCPPCRNEIPDIIKLQKELASKNFVVFGVALQREKTAAEAAKKVEEFATQKSINYINFVGDAAVIKDLTTLFGGISAVPTTFITNKKGEVVKKIIGSQSKDGFMTDIEKAMK